MIKSKYNVIGVMSGTSLDGIDLAFITFEFDEKWSLNIRNSDTISYSDVWKSELSSLVHQDLKSLKYIDTAYTTYLSNVINGFIKKFQLSNIDAICSHGHTALHQPENGLTYQIGNQKRLAELTKQIVVCNFRLQDVELGGQGAPLVPIGDELLFPEYDFCLNLGGFANISFKKNNQRIAFDICPVNIVFNHYSKIVGLDYDAYGSMASKGVVNVSLLNQLNALEYYQLDFPKSLGLEWVNLNVFPLIERYQLEVIDVLRTLVEHAVIQINVVLKQKINASVLVTGGGVFNTFLINRLKDSSQNEIKIPSDNIIEYKEALIFGLLGVLKLREETNCLASVTGAKNDHSSGVIYYP